MKYFLVLVVISGDFSFEVVDSYMNKINLKKIIRVET